MVVVLPEDVDRAEIVTSLRSAGVITHVHFTPLHRYTWFASHAIVGPSGVGAAEGLADRVLSLPLHTQLSEDDVDRVVASLEDAIAASRVTTSSRRRGAG